MPALLVAVLALAAPALSPEPGDPAERCRIVSRGYGPVGRVLVRRPTFAWSVEPQDGASVTATTVTINSRPVAASFDAGRGEVVFTPDRPLDPGDYSVEMQVVVGAGARFRKAWTTEVPREAPAETPAPREGQVAVFEALNALRRDMGLEGFTLDDALCAAANSHAAYLAQNGALGHVQTPGRPGFTGENPWDRTRAFGFSGGTWEAAGYEVPDPKEAIGAIFDAPYHRVPFMQPGTARVGVGVSTRGTVVDGEMPRLGTDGVAVSPGAGQKGVPTTWDGYERPDPLRLWPELKRPVGYPILLAAFASGDPRLTVTSASLTLDGQPVKAVLNTPANDEFLTNAACLIPAAPLRPRATYTVSFAARSGDRSVARTWSFTTGE